MPSPSPPPTAAAKPATKPQGAADRNGQPLWLTKQYAGLQALNEAYAAKGLAVLGFRNDFGAQEPGSLDEIKSFCSTTYGADFELFEKVHAKGSTTEPYTTLNQMEPSGDVEWNFEKFLWVTAP